MRRTIYAAITAALTALLVTVGLTSPASAAEPIWTYYSTSGGTQANLLGKVISSELTGASNIGGTAFNGQSSNGVAKVSVPGLINVGAITTSQVASPYNNEGLQVTSKVKIAGVDLLGGAIKVGAVDTTNIARATPSGFSREADSKLATLTIGGQSYPLSAAPNTKVEIPGIAEVVINEQITNSGGSGIETKVNALRVTLLKDIAGAKLGSTIKLGVSSIHIMNGGPSNAIPVGGFAYGTAVKVAVADAQVEVPPTAMIQLPSFGTGGKIYTNSTADVDIPQGLVKIGAIESKISGVSDVGKSDAYAENQTARLNVLGGLITADAIKVTSHVVKTQTSHLEEQKMTFVNLKVAGKTIAVNVKPNTKINVLGLGQVTINQQASAPGYSAIIGVRVTLSVKKLGLPVGADIHLAVASTFTAASN
jgi:hypothetical protein